MSHTAQRIARNPTARVRATLMALAAVVLLALPGVVAEETARGCGVFVVRGAGAAVEANCITVTGSMWIEYENCNYWGQNEHGIWLADCPTHWIISVSATNWVTPGRFYFDWPGWCDGHGDAWSYGSHDFTYECRADGPLYAARCDWPYDPGWYITVHTRGVETSAGTNSASPGDLTVLVQAPRPPPPEGC